MPLRFRGSLVAGDMGCREARKPRGGAVHGWETSVDRWGGTPGLLGANNGRLNMADLSGDRETAVAIWMKSRWDKVSNHPQRPLGLISTLSQRDLAHLQNPPRTKIPPTRTAQRSTF